MVSSLEAQSVHQKHICSRRELIYWWQHLVDCLITYRIPQVLSSTTYKCLLLMRLMQFSKSVSKKK